MDWTLRFPVIAISRYLRTLRGVRRQLKLAWLTTICVCTVFSAAGPGIPTVAAQSVWQPGEVAPYVRDSRSIDAGTITFGESNLTSSGGAVVLSYRGDGSFCPGGYNQFRFSWTFSKDISQLALNDDFTATLKIDRIGTARLDCMDLNPFISVGQDRGTDFDGFFTQTPASEGPARFYFKPSPGDNAAPRTLKLTSARLSQREGVLSAPIG